MVVGKEPNHHSGAGQLSGSRPAWLPEILE